MIANMAFLCLFVFIYLLCSARLEKTLLSGALLFMLVGWALGPRGFEVLEFQLRAEGIQFLAEITLAVVLFGDAAHARLHILQKTRRYPERLLLLGLPLTLLAGWGVAWLLFPGFSWLDAALLAVILAPTDAALGKPVVSSEEIPPHMAEALNVESGLNDGICVPLMVVLLGLADSSADLSTWKVLLTLLEKIGLGILVGASLAWLGEKWVLFCDDRKWRHPHASSLASVSLALSCFALAETIGGSGFIACFAGGLFFGALCKQSRHQQYLASEAAGGALALITWVIFGGVAVGQFGSLVTWRTALYGLLSLTLIRMLPVWICLWGTQLSAKEKLFLGWFGPRGLASIVFLVMVLEPPVGAARVIAPAVLGAVVCSVIAHGLSAPILVRKYKQD